MKNTIIAALRRILGASYVSTHDRSDDTAIEFRGTGPLRHRAGSLTAYWEEPQTVNSPSSSARVEWALFSRTHRWLGWTVETGAGEVSLHIGFGFLALYTTFESWPRFKSLTEREWKIHYDFPGGVTYGAWGSLRWKFALDPMEWSSKTPKWREGHFEPCGFFAKALLGRKTVETTTLDTHAVQVPMPEGSYAATVKIKQRTERRARIPWPVRVSRSASIDIEMGIPVPGKGENSWDCGDDAIFGTGSNEPSIAAAIGAAVRAATDHRLRHGGPDWRPPASREAVAT
jgi:hypothetical protein